MFRIFSFFIVLLLLTASCTFQKRGAQPADYKTEGFLNGNYYQYIVRKSPGKNASGLVEKRESAYLEAKNSATKIAFEKLTRYCYTLYHSKHGVPKNAAFKFNTDKLKPVLMPFVKKSYLFQEYYTHMADAVLVFRIHKQGLKKEIDSLALSPK